MNPRDLVVHLLIAPSVLFRTSSSALSSVQVSISISHIDHSKCLLFLCDPERKDVLDAGGIDQMLIPERRHRYAKSMLLIHPPDYLLLVAQIPAHSSHGCFCICCRFLRGLSPFLLDVFDLVSLYHIVWVIR